MSGYPQVPPQQMAVPNDGEVQATHMAPNQVQWMGVQSALNPAMMQAAGMMANFQQGAAQGVNPQMYFQAMQQMQPPGAIQMQVPQSVLPSPETAEKPEKGMGRSFEEYVERLSQNEIEYYSFLWKQAGCVGSQALEGKAAFDFLVKSLLPKKRLKEIWDMADWQKRGCLGWKEFVVTMKLISAAQRNQPVSLERVLQNCSPTSMDCPTFDGIETAANMFRSRTQESSQPAENVETKTTTGFDAFSAMPAPADLGIAGPTDVTSSVSTSVGADVPSLMSGTACSTTTPASSPSPPSPDKVGHDPSMFQTPLWPTTSPAAGNFQEMNIPDGKSTSGPPAAAAPVQESNVQQQEWAAWSSATSSSVSLGVSAGTGAGVVLAPTFTLPSSSLPPATPVPATTATSLEPVASTVATDGAVQSRPQENAASGGGSNKDFSQDWGDFGSSLAAPPPAPHPVSVAKPDKSPEQIQEDSGAFQGSAPTPLAPPPRPQQTTPSADSWADFAPAPPAQETGSDWAAFESAPPTSDSIAFSSSTAAAGKAGGAADQGDLWSKMSAFDDLLKADEMLGGSTAAAGLSEAFAAEAASSTATPASVTDIITPSIPAQTSAVPEGDLFEGGDDWGDFAKGEGEVMGQAAQSASKAVVPPAAGGFGDFDGMNDFGDFNSGTNDKQQPTTLPAPAVSTSSMAAGGMMDDDSGEWADFAGADNGPSQVGGTETKGPIRTPSLDFNFDDNVGPIGAGTSEAPAEVEWAAFGSAEEPAPDAMWPSSNSTPPKEVQNSQPSPPEAAWAAFDFSPDGGNVPDLAGTSTWVAGPVTEPSASVGPAFPSEKCPETEPVARDQQPWGPAESAAPEPVLFDEGWMEDGNTSGSSKVAVPDLQTVDAGSAPGFEAWGAPSLKAESGTADTGVPGSWAEFGDFDAAPAPLAVPVLETPAQASRSITPLQPPSRSLAVEPIPADPGPPPGETTKPQEVAKSPKDVPCDASFVQLAQGLAGLGFFEDAQQCKVHGEKVYLLAQAETRKKEAIQREDFEGAIQIREEIQALNSQLARESRQESWRQLLSGGTRDVALTAAEERLRQQCQCLDDAASRAALRVAVSNFGRTCPTPGCSNDVSCLPDLVRRQRRARQMSRAIDAVSSECILRFLRVLLVCLGALGEILGQCAGQLRWLAASDWTLEERKLAANADEFQALLRGLGVLRRVTWRFNLSAELFLPKGGTDGPVSAADAEDIPPKDAAMLKELHAGANTRLCQAQAAWSQVEDGLHELELSLGAWEPTECLEVGGGVQTEEQRRITSPLCALCLLPAVPLGFGAEAIHADADVSSALWRGGLWHVQCANFWIKHGARSKLLEELQMVDPFAAPG